MNNDKEQKGLTMGELVPAEAQLQVLAGKAKAVDPKDVKQVHAVRIELRDARVALTKKGKELREGALEFQKRVISKERELLSIIAPEEDRLDAIEADHKRREEIEKRRAELPARKAALDAVGLPITLSDDQLLEMSDATFNEYRLQKIEEKLKADREKADAEQREKDRAAAEKLAKEREQFEKEKREAEEKRRAEQAEIEKERARLAGIEEERRRKEAAEKAEEDRKRREAEAKAEEERKAVAAEKFQAWLRTIGHNQETDRIEWKPNGTAEVYRKVGTYNPNQQ